MSIPVNINGIHQLTLNFSGTTTATTSAGVTTINNTPAQQIELEVNGTPNGSQSLLNLASGANITLTDGGTGTVTIAASGGSGSAYTVALIGSTLPPGTIEYGTTAIAASAGSTLIASLYDPTSPGANELLSPFAYNQNGLIGWSVANISYTTVTLLSSTVLNIRVFV
jgi:hypothetical protein